MIKMHSVSKLSTLGIIFITSIFSLKLSPASAVEVPEQPTTTKRDVSISQSGIQVSASPLSDLFGYTYNDSNTPSWIDITSNGTELTFSDMDDDFVGPIDIGFDFKFYENTYSKVYISTNGLLSFGMGTRSFENQLIPSNIAPHNFIAPFWDDLILETESRVFYRLADDDSYFVVEWYQVPRIGTQDQLTFEVILEPNGNITFQYQVLPGILDQATVGIEDQHGVDGLLYLYNAQGLQDDLAIQILRPDPSPRAKIFPLYASDFVVQRNANLDFTVRNSGDDVNPQDIYDLTWIADDPGSGWSLVFSDVDGNPLVDTDSDGIVDTAPLSQGEDFDVRAEIQAPPESQAGDYVQLNVQVTSSNDTNKSASTLLQAAVPPPFAQVLLNDALGLKLLWKENEIDANTSGLQLIESSLSTPGVISLANGYFLYTWEDTQFYDGKLLTNLEYMILYPFGGIYQAITDLTNHDTAEQSTLDQEATFASNSAGFIAGVWVRSLLETKRNENVHFSILDPNLQPNLDQMNLTNNSSWRGPGDLDVPYYDSPRVAATGDDRFVLAWVDDRLKNGGSTTDVVYSVYDQSGNQISSPNVLTQSEPGGVQYGNPTLVGLEGPQALLAYTIDLAGVSSSIGYVIINSGGSKDQGETDILGSQGSSPDGVRLATGEVLLAWHDASGGEVGYAVIDGDTHGIKSGPHTIQLPDGRVPNEVSVTKDEDGNGIITWGDALQNDHLYYALVDGEGHLVTPAMIFLTGSGSDPEVKTNSSGLGNAPYQGWYQTFTPILVR